MVAGFQVSINGRFWVSTEATTAPLGDLARRGVARSRRSESVDGTPMNAEGRETEVRRLVTPHKARTDDQSTFRPRPLYQTPALMVTLTHLLSIGYEVEAAGSELSSA